MAEQGETPGPAKEIEAYWECPKCHDCFYDDGKHYPAGILCPSCRKRGLKLVGVLFKVRATGASND